MLCNILILKKIKLTQFKLLDSIISELVETALKEEQDTCEVDGVKSVFMAILQSPGLDIRDKKAGIIDFIAAGIKTVSLNQQAFLELVNNA